MALITKNRIALVLAISGAAAMVFAAIVHLGRSDFMAGVQGLTSTLAAVALMGSTYLLRENKTALWTVAVGLGLCGLASVLGVFSYL